ncbi:hypothetical protein D3C73_1596980 [compost metagenome]
MATGKVWLSDPPRKISEVKKSFQTIRPAKIVTVPVAGAIMGSTILEKIWNRVAPSMVAASS